MVVDKKQAMMGRNCKNSKDTKCIKSVQRIETLLVYMYIQSVQRIETLLVCTVCAANRNTVGMYSLYSE